MAAILGGIGAALFWGTSTFCSSRSTRMIGAASALAWVMLVGFVVIAPIAAVRGVAGNADGADVFWPRLRAVDHRRSCLSYVALRRGKVSIVAPICATEGAIAALVAVAFGQRLAATTLIALGVIAGGVILASTGNEVVDGHSSRTSVALAMLAASLFGISLYASGRIGPSLGAAAIILAARGLGVTVIFLPLLLQRRLRLSRNALPDCPPLPPALEPAGYVSVQQRLAAAMCSGACRAFESLRSVAGVLGFLVLGERLRRLQFAGVAATVLGVVVLSGLQA